MNRDNGRRLHRPGSLNLLDPRVGVSAPRNPSQRGPG